MIKKRFRALLVIVPGLLLILLSVVIRQTSAAARRANCVALNEWNIEYGEGETVLTSWLSFYFDTPFPSVMMKTDYGAVEVLLGDETVYAYPENYDGSSYVGRTLHFVNLPEDFGGRLMTVRIFADRASFSADYPSPLFGDYRNLFRLFVQEHLPALLTGVFLLLFGIVFLLLTVLFSLQTAGAAPHVLSALLAADLGVWMLGDYLVFILLSYGNASGILPLAAFYLALPLTLLLLHYLHPEARWLKHASLFAFMPVILAVLLHLTHVMPADRLFLPYSVVLLFFFGACILQLIRKKRSGVYTEPGVAMQERGLLILGLCLALALIFRNLYLQLGVFAVQFTLMLLVIGCNTYTVTLILNYYLHISESYARKKEYRALNQLAYVDVLTGLQNRKSVDNLFRVLDSTRSNYCIVLIELGGLKLLNERYGHEAGDKMLRNLADVLNDCFGEHGFRARQGGNEFLVVINRIPLQQLQSLLMRATGTFDMMKPVAYRTDVSFSYGYAFREERPMGGGRGVYALAEERMLEQKRAYRLSADRP
ncbi:MAG: GGDEF domain-containing protein [Lachnospiraceae bacterium]|nr:GGDEF domain-containing protein [Lachnospiraceae bacterium]